MSFVQAMSEQIQSIKNSIRYDEESKGITQLSNSQNNNSTNFTVDRAQVSYQDDFQLGVSRENPTDLTNLGEILGANKEGEGQEVSGLIDILLKAIEGISHHEETESERINREESEIEEKRLEMERLTKMVPYFNVPGFDANSTTLFQSKKDSKSSKKDSEVINTTKNFKDKVLSLVIMGRSVKDHLKSKSTRNRIKSWQKGNSSNKMLKKLIEENDEYSQLFDDDSKDDIGEMMIEMLELKDEIPIKETKNFNNEIDSSTDLTFDTSGVVKPPPFLTQENYEKLKNFDTESNLNQSVDENSTGNGQNDESFETMNSEKFKMVTFNDGQVEKIDKTQNLNFEKDFLDIFISCQLIENILLACFFILIFYGKFLLLDGNFIEKQKNELTFNTDLYSIEHLNYSGQVFIGICSIALAVLSIVCSFLWVVNDYLTLPILQYFLITLKIVAQFLICIITSIALKSWNVPIQLLLTNTIFTASKMNKVYSKCNNTLKKICLDAAIIFGVILFLDFFLVNLGLKDFLIVQGLTLFMSLISHVDYYKAIDQFDEVKQSDEKLSSHLVKILCICFLYKNGWTLIQPGLARSFFILRQDQLRKSYPCADFKKYY